LFSEQQKRFNVGYADKKSPEPCKGLENKKARGRKSPAGVNV
jgi:hypothetical protein